MNVENPVQAVALRNTEDDVLTSLAGRPARLEHRLTREQAIDAARMRRGEIR